MKVHDLAQRLREAVQESSSENIRQLLEAGADINAEDDAGETAMIKAAAQANAPMVNLLIERGADLDARSRDGLTALCCAAEASRWIDQDASVEDVHDLLSRALQVRYDDASQCVQTLEPYPENDILATIEVLLRAGANPNPQGVDEPPLAGAARLGYLQVMKVLLAAGAQIENSARENAQLYEQREALVLLREASSRNPAKTDGEEE